MHSSAKTDHTLNVRITHKTARVPLMEAVAFKDKSSACRHPCLRRNEECLILQTCNRIEIFAVSEDENSLDLIKEYFAKRAMEHSAEAAKAIETAMDNESFSSPATGNSWFRDQWYRRRPILNQVWDAYLAAEKRQNHRSNPKTSIQSRHDRGRRVRTRRALTKAQSPWVQPPWN